MLAEVRTVHSACDFGPSNRFFSPVRSEAVDSSPTSGTKKDLKAFDCRSSTLRGSTGSSFVLQRHHRIDARCAARGDQASQGRDGQQQYRNHRDSQPVTGLEAVEQRPHQSSRNPR